MSTGTTQPVGWLPLASGSVPAARASDGQCVTKRD
jgi:hypothetical protein